MSEHDEVIEIVERGPRGPIGEGEEGKSAYEVWLDLGNEGTEQDFIDYLKASGVPSEPVILEIENGRVVWPLENLQTAKLLLTEDAKFIAPTNIEEGAEYRLVITNDELVFAATFGNHFKFDGVTPENSDEPFMSTVYNFVCVNGAIICVDKDIYSTILAPEFNGVPQILSNNGNVVGAYLTFVPAQVDGSEPMVQTIKLYRNNVEVPLDDPYHYQTTLDDSAKTLKISQTASNAEDSITVESEVLVMEEVIIEEPEGSYSAAAEALFARMDVQPNETRKGLIDTFMRKIPHILVKLDALYVVGATEQQSKLNWVGDIYNATCTGTYTFTPDRGFQGTDVDFELHTGMFPNGQTKYKKDNACMGAVMQDTVGTASRVRYIGGCGISGGTQTSLRVTNTVLNGSSYRLNSNATRLLTVPSMTPAHWCLSKWGQTSGARAIYRDNTTIEVVNDPNVSGDISVWVAEFKFFSTGVGSQWRGAMFYVGAGLSPREYLDLYYASNEYLAAIGAMTSVPEVRTPIANHRMEVNYSAFEIGSPSTGGTPGTTYPYADTAHFAYLKSKGINHIRVPFRWERMQPTLGGSLNTTYLDMIKQALTFAHDNAMTVTLDMHNYGGRSGQGKIGGGTITKEHFADAWSKIITELPVGSYPALTILDIMNEPSNMPYQNAWYEAAQAGIDAIRLAGSSHLIMIEGNNFSGAYTWIQAGNDKLRFLYDATDNLMYSAHCYLDSDNSGTGMNWLDEVAQGDQLDPGQPLNTDIGIKRISVFGEWCKAHGLRGNIGECGAGYDHEDWLVAYDKAIQCAKDYGLSFSGWVTGPFYSSYPYNIGLGPVDRPQMAVITKYTDAPVSLYYSVSGPNFGQPNQPSSNFTIDLRGYITDPVTFTPNDGGAGGTFTPTSRTIGNGFNGTATFTYTGPGEGVYPITVTNNKSLTVPSTLGYATVPDLFANLGTGVEPQNVLSFFKIKADYLGPAIKLRRSSDNTERTFNFSSLLLYAPLPIADIETWAGGTNLWIVEWYDQSGKNFGAGPVNTKDTYEDAAAARLSDQPLFLTHGKNNKPIARWNPMEYTVARWTTGQPTVTNFVNGSEMKVEVGMIFFGDGIPAGATITNVSGSTLTLSVNATKTKTVDTTCRYGFSKGSRMDMRSPINGYTGLTIISGFKTTNRQMSRKLAWVLSQTYNWPNGGMFGIDQQTSMLLDEGQWASYASRYRAFTLNGNQNYKNGVVVQQSNPYMGSDLSKRKIFFQYRNTVNLGYFKYSDDTYTGTMDDIGTIVLKGAATDAAMDGFFEYLREEYDLPAEPAPFVPVATVPPAPGEEVPLPHCGYNLAGGEFEGSPFYPATNEIDYMASRGFNIARVPFRWERLQRNADADLDEQQMLLIDAAVARITEKGMVALLDCHNYGAWTPSYKRDAANVSATITTDSAVLTNYQTKNVYPGFLLTNSTYLQADTRVLSIDGPTTLTMTKTAIGTGTGNVNWSWGGTMTETGNTVTGAPSYAQFAEFWRKMAARYKNNPNVAFDLMNEPNKVSAATMGAASQAAITAIRDEGFEGWIHVEGGGSYAAASAWISSGAAAAFLALVDPLDKLIAHMHAYLDEDNSGTHDTATKDGATRLVGVTDFARANGIKCFIGEMGMANTPSGQTENGEMLAFMKANDDVWAGWTVWAGGRAWPDGYMFKLSPNGEWSLPIVDKPQIKIMYDNRIE